METEDLEDLQHVFLIPSQALVLTETELVLTIILDFLSRNSRIIYSMRQRILGLTRRAGSTRQMFLIRLSSAAWKLHRECMTFL